MNYREASVDVIVVGVGPRSVAPGREDTEREQRDHESTRHRGAVLARDLVFVVLLGVIAPAAGIGLLYLLRQAGVASLGPRPAGALPLEQLASADAQPLARMALAWLPVGLAVGALIAAFTRTSRAWSLALMTLVAAIVLVTSGGVSESVENNESLTAHLAAPLGLAGTWVSLVLLVIGALVGARLAGAGRRAPSAA
jgi:hypothetical protein